MKNKKLLMLTFVLVLAFLATSSPITMANNTAAEEASLDFTMGALQDLVLEHLSESGIEIGTGAYYNYVVEQLIEGADVLLSQKEEYPLIHAYMANYKCMADEAEINEAQDAIAYTPFYLSADFLDLTVGELKERIEDEMPVDSVSGISVLGLSNYSGSAAASYARTYSQNYNSSYPDYSISLPSGGDCTNFASQCVYAGGLGMSGGANGLPYQVGNFEETTTEWYCSAYNYYGPNQYAPGFQVSTSWTRVTDFDTYLSNRPGNSRSTKTDLTQLKSACAVGDIVLLKSTTTLQPYHSIIISSTEIHAGTKYVYYCGHTSNRTDYSVNNIDDAENDYILHDLT